MKSYLSTLLIIVLLVTLASGQRRVNKRGVQNKYSGRFRSNSGDDSNDGQSSVGDGAESNTSGDDAAGNTQAGGSGFGSGSGAGFGSGSGNRFGSGSGVGSGSGSGVGTGASA